MELKTFITGSLLTNCYLIFEKDSKSAFLVDAAPAAEQIKEFIREQRLNLEFIVLTHGHFDHIGGLNAFEEPFYIHVKDAAFLKDANLNFSAFLGYSFTVARDHQILETGPSLSFRGRNIEVLHTPGHTPGSVSLKIENWLFSGDALFFDSIGRTDIPLASSKTLLTSIKEKILPLDARTEVYPGHGPATTVGREKGQNHFLQ